MDANFWWWVFKIVFAVVSVVLVLGNKIRVWQYCIIAIPVLMVEYEFFNTGTTRKEEAFFIGLMVFLCLLNFWADRKKEKTKKPTEEKPDC